MGHLSKTVSRIFHFRSRLVFIKLYIFVRQKAYSLALKRHNRKATHSFAPRPLIFKLQQEILKFNDTSWVGAPQNLPGDQIF